MSARGSPVRASTAALTHEGSGEQSPSVKARTSPVATASAALRAAYDPDRGSRTHRTPSWRATTAAMSSVEPLSATTTSSSSAG